MTGRNHNKIETSEQPDPTATTGTPLSSGTSADEPPPTRNRYAVAGITAAVCAWLTPLIMSKAPEWATAWSLNILVLTGLGLSTAGLRATRRGAPHKRLAIAGLMLTAPWTVGAVVLWALLVNDVVEMPL